jgi:hypothetical protein
MSHIAMRIVLLLKTHFHHRFTFQRKISLLSSKYKFLLLSTAVTTIFSYIVYMIWYDMIRYDMIWYDMIWYDMIWYDMIWYDMIWYDTFALLQPRSRHFTLANRLLSKWALAIIDQNSEFMFMLSHELIKRNCGCISRPAVQDWTIFSRGVRKKFDYYNPKQE